MNHPKPHQVRLPFSVPKPKKGQAPQARICGLCRKNDSKYSCPRCNVAYCSLDCFKSQKHAQCSEPFYRETILSEVAQDPKQSTEEKKRMVEMLQRLEEGAEDDEAVLRQLAMMEGEEGEGEGGAEDDELAEKLAGVDLDTIDSNALFHLLPPAHRDKFIAALRDPDGEEARRLVEVAAQRGDGEDGDAAEKEAVPEELPWWEADLLAGSTDEADVAADDEPPYALPPDMIPETVLGAIKVPEGVGARLRYNVVAVSLAYLHLLLSFRLPSLDPTYLVAPSDINTPDMLKSSLAQLVPFLTDQRSTVRYESLRSAWSAAWDAVGTTLDPKPPQALLVRLLSMLPQLLHPPIDTTQPPRVLFLLSDLYALYARPKAGGAIPRKLAFYVVALRQLGRDDWLALEREVQAELRKLESELGEDKEDKVAKPPSNYLA